MPEQDVTLKFSAPGADAVSKALADAAKGLQDVARQITAASRASDEHTDKTKQQKGAVGSLVDSIRGLRDSYEQGGAATTGFGSSMNVLSAAFKAATSPLGMLTIGLGAFAVMANKATDAAMEIYREVRQLQAMSGLAAEAADELSDTFKLAGIEGGGLTMALFRMSNQVESGGKQLQRFGIDIRDANGELKTEGDLLLEVRDMLGEMGDASQRNATLMQLFGRAGRSLAPAFALSREEFERLRQTAAKYNDVTEEFMKRAKDHARAQEEMRQRWEKVKITLAETVGIPMQSFFLGLSEAAMKASVSVTQGLTRAFFGLKSLLTGRLFTKEGRRELIDVFVEPAKKGEQAVKESTEGKKRLTEAEAQRNIQALRAEDELRRKRVQGDQQYLAEETKMRTGSDVAALQSRIRSNEEMIQAARDLYEQTREEYLKVSPKIDVETEAKLVKERDEKILSLEQENRMSLLKIKQAQAADTKRVMDEELQVVKANATARVDAIKFETERTLAINKSGLDSSTEIVLLERRIKEAGARETLDAKLGALRTEETELRAYAAKYPDLFQVQHEVEQKLIDLGQRRQQAEMEANREILNARRALVDGLKQEADREANIGDQLTQKAMERLKKRGKKFVTRHDVESEAADMQREAAQTIGQFGMGGRVSMEKLQEGIGMRGVMGQMTQMGTSIAGAIQQMLQQTFSALAGQRQAFMPTTVQAGPGGQPTFMGPPSADPIVQAYQSAFKQLPEIVDKSIADVAERIDRGWNTVAETISVKVASYINRAMEFDAART